MIGKSGRAAPPGVLAPGFRFHPTDDELVSYYLRRKVSGKPCFDYISDIDIYKFEPLDLPGLSKLKSKDREWYFFSPLDRKYGNGTRTNRATEQGYWKTTGKDRPIHHKDKENPVGMKKTLVYHIGRAPHGKRTNWVMHEYKLVENEGYVVCRIFQKSGSGPKNGEQYGAELVEEEWEDNEVCDAAAAGGCVLFEDPYSDDHANGDAFLEQNDLPQVFNQQLPQSVPFPYNFNNQGTRNRVEDCRYVTSTDQKPSVGVNEYDSRLEMISDLSQAGCSPDVVKDEYTAAPISECNQASLILGELFSNDVGSLPFDENTAAPNNECNKASLSLGELFSNDVGSLPFDEHTAAPNNDCNQASLSLGELFSNDVGSLPFDDGQLFDASAWDPASFDSILDDDIAAYLNFDSTPEKIDANIDLSYASWVKDIPAPPANASEMPTKEIVSRLTAAVLSSSSVPLSAGMIRIRDIDMPMLSNGSRLQLSFDKTGNVNVLFLFNVPQTVSPAELDSLTAIFSSKIAAAVSRGWMYFMFFWVFVFAVSMRIGTSIYAK